MAYVITCGDEGVQINEGTRLGFAGAGFNLDGFSEAVKLLKKVLGEEIRIGASEENDWVKSQLDLSNWEQTSASMQQHIEALADKEGLLYIGLIPFTDPKELKHDIKGHMVRPHGIHIGNKLSFTLGGGEDIYNLGNFVISADWVAEADEELVKKVLQPQIDFYTQLVGGNELQINFQREGSLDEETVVKNEAMLKKVGIVESE